MCSIEKDLLPISALQHLAFCPRQCALIHIEREWTENVLTTKGWLEHDRSDSGFREFRRGKRQVSGLFVESREYGLFGQLDVLEMVEKDANGPDNLPMLQLKGTWETYPVEFKHGQPKENDCDRIQLCAQVLCLEEMLNIHIDEASLFYQRIRRREDVVMGQLLREKTKQMIEALHQLFETKVTPQPVNDKRCRACSLNEICMPKKMGKSTQYKQILFKPQEVA